MAETFLNGDRYTGGRDDLSEVFFDGKDLYECYVYGGIWKNGSKLLQLYDPGNLKSAAADRLYFMETFSIKIYDATTGQKLFDQALSSDNDYRNTGMVVTSDGTAYVVGYCFDAFGKRVGRLWIISKDLKVSEQTLYDGGSEEVGLDVDVDSDGNVWALTRGKGLNLYKNGKFVRVVNKEPDGNQIHFLSFHGKDMYIVTTKYGQKEIVVYKNDKVLYDISNEAGLIATTKPMFSKNGDIYFGASDWNNSLVYKNGKLQLTLLGWWIFSMAVLG